jgi:uncharacterized protein (DUF1800 family)
LKYLQYKIIILLIFSNIIIGCNSTSSTDNNNILINGKAIDGYISQATVKIIDKDTNNTLLTTTTDSNGSFTFYKPINKDIIVEIIGGVDTMTNEPFEGSMKNIISSEDSDNSINITPLTTLVVELVNDGENIQNAQNIISNTLEIDIATLNSDPIVLLQDGNNTQQDQASKVMKNIIKIEKLAQIVSSVSSDKNTTYKDVFKTISKKAKQNRSQNIDTILENLTIIDEIASNQNELEQNKILAIKDVVQKLVQVLDDINTTNTELTNSALASEVIEISLNDRIDSIRQATNINDINSTKQQIDKTINSIIVLGGQKGIRNIIKNSSNTNIHQIANSLFTDDNIEQDSIIYNDAIDTGKTIDDILRDNSSNDITINSNEDNNTEEDNTTINITETNSTNDNNSTNTTTNENSITEENNTTINTSEANSTNENNSTNTITNENNSTNSEQDIVITPNLVTQLLYTQSNTNNIEINGTVGDKIYVNGTLKGTINENGKLLITIETANIGENIFKIRAKNSNNKISEALNFSIEKKQITRKDAIKFLRQAAFRTTEDDITYIINNGYEAWIDNQYSLVSELDDENDNNYGYLETTLRILNSYNPEFYPSEVISDPTQIDETIIDGKRLDLFKNSVFWDKALNSQNQLRQRVTYALSQILVVSNDSPAGKAPTSRGETMITYYDKLYRHSFGNYRDLLFDVTRSSAMGYFLTYIGSSKYAPDENYARELTQLFTVGLYELNLDGTKKLDSNGNPIPSYDQQHVTDLSHVFTGWALDNKQGDDLNFGANGKSDGSWVSDLRFISQKHSVGINLDLIGDATMTTSEDGIADINTALDILFANHNVAPFISRHLIMRLVTSNPTPQYIQRVATVFNDNGNGVKGDLKAVVKAILLDPEARGYTETENFGKVDEMLIAYSHFMSHFKAKPAPRMVINTRISKGVLENRDVNNIYWIDPQKEFGQAPLGAPTVFNFYSNEFIPSDEYFAQNSVVSPELELQNIPNLIGFSNLVESVLTLREKYYILELTTLQKGSGSNGTYESMEEWANDVTLGIGGQGLYLDLSEEYNIFEKALDNENIANNDFTNLGDGSGENENQTRAVNALIEHLDNKLFGNTMSQEYKDALLSHVNSFDYNANNRNRASRMKAIVPTIIRAIITSPLFMVLK